MQEERMFYLFDRYARKQNSVAENAELFALIADARHDETLGELVQSLLETVETIAQLPPNQSHAIFQSIVAADRKQAPLRKMSAIRQWGWVAAVSLLLIALAGIYMARQWHNRSQIALDKGEVKLPPGCSGAILTLSDGRQLILDSVGNGVVALENGVRIEMKNGRLLYNGVENAVAALINNTMSTPRGRQFQLQLPDGTKVWLNAASSITYPVYFGEQNRRVLVNGEAYFEVVKDVKRPFVVDVDRKATIEVLGTSFNISSYFDDHQISTALLEGSIRLVPLKDSVRGVILKPGQAADLSSTDETGSIRIKPDADMDKVLAWKNGVFHFEGFGFAEIMRQIARWYDVEVVYEQGVPEIQFEGEVTRNLSLDDLLLMLKRSDVHFRLEGRKLVVLP